MGPTSKWLTISNPLPPSCLGMTPKLLGVPGVLWLGGYELMITGFQNEDHPVPLRWPIYLLVSEEGRGHTKRRHLEVVTKRLKANIIQQLKSLNPKYLPAKK